MQSGISGISSSLRLDGGGAGLADVDVGHAVAHRLYPSRRRRDHGHARRHGRQVRHPDVRTLVAVVGQSAAGIVGRLRAGVAVDMVLDRTERAHVTEDRQVELGRLGLGAPAAGDRNPKDQER